MRFCIKQKLAMFFIIQIFQIHFLQQWKDHKSLINYQSLIEQQLFRQKHFTISLLNSVNFYKGCNFVKKKLMCKVDTQG